VAAHPGNRNAVEEVLPSCSEYQLRTARSVYSVRRYASAGTTGTVGTAKETMSKPCPGSSPGVGLGVLERIGAAAVGGPVPIPYRFRRLRDKDFGSSPPRD
jgi:hypothetical protein